MPPNGSGADATRLATNVASGVAATAALQGHLKAERDALERQDCDALLEAAAAKQQALDSLEAIEAERVRLLRNAGLAADEQGMQAVAIGYPELSDAWQRYKDLASACRDENLTNGAILRLRHQQFAGAFAVLSGSGPPTYGPAGTSDGRSTRALAEA